MFHITTFGGPKSWTPGSEWMGFRTTPLRVTIPTATKPKWNGFWVTRETEQTILAWCDVGQHYLWLLERFLMPIRQLSPVQRDYIRRTVARWCRFLHFCCSKALRRRPSVTSGSVRIGGRCRTTYNRKGPHFCAKYRVNLSKLGFDNDYSYRLRMAGGLFWLFFTESAVHCI